MDADADSTESSAARDMQAIIFTPSISIGHTMLYHNCILSTDFYCTCCELPLIFNNILVIYNYNDYISYLSFF